MSPRPIEFPVEGLTDGLVRLRLPADADVARIVELVAERAGAEAPAPI